MAVGVPRGVRAPRDVGHREDACRDHRDGAAPGGSARRTSGRHRPAPRHPPRTRAAGAHPSGRAAAARSGADAVAAQDAGHADRARRSGAVGRRAARPDARRERHGLRHADVRGGPAVGGLPTGGCRTAGPLPGGAARRVPGHRACAAGRVVGAVRRRGRRRAGIDRRRRPDSVDLRLAGCVGDEPAPVHHGLLPCGRHPGADAGTAHQLAQPAPCAPARQRGLGGGAPPFGRRARAATQARRPTRHHSVRAVVRRRRANETGWQTDWRPSTATHATRGRPCRRPRCSSGATPTPHPSPTH